DSAGLVTVTVSEGAEWARQRARTEQGEPGDEGLESSDAGAQVPIVRVLVPDHDLGLRAPEPDGSLAVPDGGPGRTRGGLRGDDPYPVENRNGRAPADSVFRRGGHGRPVGHREDEGALTGHCRAPAADA